MKRSIGSAVMFARCAVLAALILSSSCSKKDSAQLENDASANFDWSDIPSLQARLDSLSSSSASRVPAELMSVMKTGIQQVAEGTVLETALKVGDAAPTFGLMGTSGKVIQLPGLLKKGPVVLVFYRGGWCPYCNLQLAALQDVLPEIERLGATLLAIGPEIPDSGRATYTRHQLGFDLLSDVGNRVARSYGLAYAVPREMADALSKFVDVAAYNGDDSGELPLTATYVINRQGIITYAFFEVDYKRRAEPVEILETLKQLYPRTE
ncbi:MAG: peroxiredoxin-like family protein [bacterium]